jgi:hypothetical protein
MNRNEKMTRRNLYFFIMSSIYTVFLDAMNSKKYFYFSIVLGLECSIISFPIYFRYVAARHCNYIST